MMSEFTLTFLRNLLKYPPEPNAFALKTRQQVPLQCQINLPVHGVRTEHSSSESQGYTRVSRQSERLSFSRKILHIGDNVVTDWQTVISVSSQYFLLPQDYDMIFSSSKNVLVMRNSSFADHCNAGWMTLKLMLSVSRLHLNNGHMKHKILIFDPRTASCNPKLDLNESSHS
jgi:hypothetical protein